MSVREIRGEGLTLRAGETALVSDLDLSAHAGEILGVTGPSASGKTTLLYALGGLIPASTGRLWLDERPVDALWREAALGTIFQNLCLVPLLSAQETVTLPLQARKMPKPAVEQVAGALLERLGLGGHTGQLVGQLSGGQRQRVAVARALAGAPEVILADEPASALDPRWRGVVLDLLVEAARSGAIVILASSDAEVTAVCDRVVTLT